MLEVTALCKAFDSKAVLRDFSWEIPTGSVVGLTGAVGTGKTTLLRLIAGLEAPDAGRITWEGGTWSAKNALLPPWKRPLAMVFQQSSLWPHLTVQGQLEFVMRSSTFSTSERRHRTEQMLEQLSLESLGHRYPAELSGGQQQCVAVARALVREPKLLLLDEPFSQMDDATQDTAWGVTRNVQSSIGATLILVTHDTAWARSSCESVRQL